MAKKSKKLQVIVRAMDENDLDAAAEIMLSRKMLKQKGDKKKIRLMLDNPQSICLLAEVKGKPAGTLLALFDGFNVFLSHLTVSGEYENMGVGSALNRELVLRAKDLGASMILTDSKLTATGFYHKQGYRIAESVLMVRDKL